MIQPEIGDVVRLKSGSPKFIVTAVSAGETQPSAEIFGWSDRQGFVSRAVPVDWLVWPRPHDGDERA